MLFVQRTDPGVVELNFMWLPSFIGMNAAVQQEIEKKLSPLLQGKPMTEDTLKEAHEYVIDFLCQRFPLKGLRDYLDAVKFVME